ncbi:MAG: hypothetical protein ACJ739_07750 [Acidimicrobiales bacterium]
MTAVRRTAATLLLTAAVLVGASGVAAAQDGELVGDVQISFDVGDLDPRAGDWTIDAVEVSGDLEDGQEFTLVLTKADGAELWSSTQEFTGPVTRIEVSRPLTVADVASAGVEQGLTEVAGVQIEPPTVDYGASGGGGGGQLALSMVMAVLLVAIVFRTPLPSASTQRWTK